MQVMGGLKSYSKDALEALSSGKKQSNLASKVALKSHGLYRNSYHAMRSVIQTEGFRSLFAGVGVTILRDIPFSITYFLAYESSKTLQQRLYKGSEAKNKLGPINHLIAGAFAAACGVCVSNPLDVIKTRLQTQGSLQHKRYSGILQCAKMVYAEDGVMGFSRGLVPRMLYLCPSAAITFSLYEIFKSVYAKAWGGDPSRVKGIKTHSQQISTPK